jgi:hypothetical protein
LSVLWFTASDYRFGIFKLFLNKKKSVCVLNVCIVCICLILIYRLSVCVFLSWFITPG